MSTGALKRTIWRSKEAEFGCARFSPVALDVCAVVCRFPNYVDKSQHGIAIYNTETGAQLQQIRTDKQVKLFQFSSDGARIAFVTDSFESFTVVTLATNTQQLVQSESSWSLGKLEDITWSSDMQYLFVLHAEGLKVRH